MAEIGRLESSDCIGQTLQCHPDSIHVSLMLFLRKGPGSLPTNIVGRKIGANIGSAYPASLVPLPSSIYDAQLRIPQELLEDITCPYCKSRYSRFSSGKLI
jgi:hypothetical protein